MAIYGRTLLCLLLLHCYAQADKCDTYQRELADTQAHFVQCTVNHAVPVKLCDGCFEEYKIMQSNYKQLTEDANCTAKYFNKDRINLIGTTQNLLEGLWNRAYCDDCFKSNNTDIFDGKSATLSVCLSTHKMHPCEDCLMQYTDLNSFYKNLDEHNNGKVCYDMQDAMNRTRLHWSKELKCCQRETHLTLFIVAISIIAFLPILFYGTTYALTKRSERNHGLLNDIEESEPETAASTATLIAAAILATRRPEPAQQSPPKPTTRKWKVPAADDSFSDSDSDVDNNTTKRQP